MRFRSGILVALTLPLAACATQGVQSTAGAPASVNASPPKSSAPPPVSAASSLVYTHPLTCFPASPVAFVGGVPDAQQDQVTPQIISAATPALVTIQWPAEPANVSLASASVELTPHQGPGTPIGQTPSPPAAPPAPPEVVKSVPLGTPTAGSTSHVSLDGTGNAAGVAARSGLYDVVVVREVIVASTCLSFTAGGPTSTVQVTTTIGHVRLP